MAEVLLTAEQVRERLRKACEEAGGQYPWSRLHGFGQPMVNLVINGRRGISDKMAAEIGLRRVVAYVPVIDEARDVA